MPSVWAETVPASDRQTADRQTNGSGPVCRIQIVPVSDIQEVVLAMHISPSNHFGLQACTPVATNFPLNHSTVMPIHVVTTKLLQVIYHVAETFVYFWWSVTTNATNLMYLCLLSLF